jgi:hypothetical protein
MSCVRCAGLLRTLRSAQSSYEAARLSSFYVVTNELVARKKVDMERAKGDLFEHQRICRAARTTDRVQRGCLKVSGTQPNQMGREAFSANQVCRTARQRTPVHPEAISVANGPYHSQSCHTEVTCGMAIYQYLFRSGEYTSLTY